MAHSGHYPLDGDKTGLTYTVAGRVLDVVFLSTDPHLASLYCLTVPGSVLLLPGAKISDIWKLGLASNKKQFCEMCFDLCCGEIDYCVNAAIYGSLASIATDVWNSRKWVWWCQFLYTPTLPVVQENWLWRVKTTLTPPWKGGTTWRGSFDRSWGCRTVVARGVAFHTGLSLCFFLKNKIQFWEGDVSKDFLYCV